MRHRAIRALPQFFRAHRRQPRQIAVKPAPRTSPRERGYDAKWDRFSAAYRRKNPFCAECQRIGRLRFGDVVDHKVPVADGGAVHCGEDGVWNLCASHHGWKGRLEAYARSSGLMSQIRMWCDEPETRPLVR